MRKTCSLLALLFFAATTSACGSLSADRCDRECDCERCGTRTYDECILVRDWEQDRADAYGCDVEYEEFALCEIDLARCPNGNYWLDPMDCDRERANLLDCVNDASSL